MRAVVIGGSGQIGGWLLHHLKTRGHEAVGTYATIGLPDLVPLNAAEKARAADWVVRQAPEVVVPAFRAVLEELLALDRTAAPLVTSGGDPWP